MNLKTVTDMLLRIIKGLFGKSPGHLERARVDGADHRQPSLKKPDATSSAMDLSGIAPADDDTYGKFIAQLGSKPVMRTSEWLDAFTYLRPLGSVHHLPRLGSWMVLDHGLAEGIMKDTSTFSNIVYKPFDDTLLGTDPPEHTMMRSVVQSLFLPKHMKDMEDYILMEFERLIETAGLQEEFDMVGHVCRPLVLSINGRLLGLTENEVSQILREIPEGVLHEDHRKVEELFSGILVAEGRTSESEGLLGMLVGLLRENRITLKKATGLMKLVWTAGSGTSYALLSHLSHMLLTRPDLRIRLTEDPQLIKSFVEETLRLHPTPIVTRTVTRDIELEGKKIAAGSMVMVSLIAANRDPSVFERPDECLLDRPARRHFAFGNGAHHCLGSHVARMVFSGFVRKMLPVADRIELQPMTEPEFICASDFNGAARLLVRWKTIQQSNPSG